MHHFEQLEGQTEEGKKKKRKKGRPRFARMQGHLTASTLQLEGGRSTEQTTPLRRKGGQT